MINPSYPVSKATNAYELLEDACEAILEEPKRYYQGWWKVTSDSKHYTYERYNLVKPPCDTVCCVAGTVCALKRIDITTGFSATASAILGIDDVEEAFELFRANALEGLTTADPQTREYAEAGVKHIRAFMRKYEGKLKAKQV